MGAENSLSAVAPVVSDVIQSSYLGPGFYTVLANTLQSCVKIPTLAFASDFKFVADIKKYSSAEIQADVNVVAQYTEERHMPFLLEKCAKIHCGNQQTVENYINNDTPLFVSRFLKTSAFCDMRHMPAIKATAKPSTAKQVKKSELSNGVSI